MEPVIRLNSVTKRFGRQVALNGVSLEVPPGVVFALLGENGAGKTTALRILLGLTEPDAGEASVLGLNSRTHGLEIRRQVGYVAERPTLYDWMTVGEIGWFTAGFYPNGFQERYCELTEQFGLSATKRLKQLSKGMRAKVALAIAMAHNPKVLILDEPTSGLDAMVRREFLESMVERAAAGQTVLLSSHQINEVERVADIVAIIHHGELLLVERLEIFKNQVQELTVTLANGAPAPPDIEGEILREERRSRQWQVLTRNLSDEQLKQLHNHTSVVAVETRRPSLEEIFVAYMQCGAVARHSVAAGESAVAGLPTEPQP